MQNPALASPPSPHKHICNPACVPGLRFHSGTKAGTAAAMSTVLTPDRTIGLGNTGNKAGGACAYLRGMNFDEGSCAAMVAVVAVAAMAAMVEVAVAAAEADGSCGHGRRNP